MAAPPYQPLVALAAAFMAGITADRCLSTRVEWWWLAAAALLGAWLLAWRWRMSRIAACLLLAATAMFGAARHHTQWSIFAQNDLGRSAGAAPQAVCLEVVALESPRWRPAPAPSPLSTFDRGDQSQLDVLVVRVRDRDRWRPASGKGSLFVEGHLVNVAAGDRLRVLGQFQRNLPPLNPGEYDFSEHERSERKLCRISADHPDSVTLVAHGAVWRPRRWINGLRSGGDELLWRYVGDRRGGLASALILGLREQLDRQKLEPYFLTGTMHVLAISGLNIGILAAGFWVIVRLGIMPRRAALVVAVVLVILYAALTGAEPPVVRSAILVIAFCVGRFLGRPVLSFHTLAAAALVVLAINPTELFDAGAQLSFLAVAALGLAAPRVALWRRPPQDPLDRLIAQTRPWPRRAARAGALRIAQTLAVSAAVWLALLPLTMYRFHLASPEAVLLNLVIGFPLAMALFAGFGVLLLGNVFPPAASLSGAVCDGSLSVLERMIQEVERLLGMHAWTPGPAAWWVVGCYAGLVAWAAFPQWRPPRRWLAAIAVSWMALGLSPPDHGFPETANAYSLSRAHAGLPGVTSPADHAEELACTFIAVGHGVSVLVELPDGRTLLYDAGGLGPPVRSARAIAGVLWSRGLRRVDAVIVSHADADHYNALPELLKMFDVGVIYVSPVMFENEAPGLAALREAITQAQVPLEEVHLGHRLEAGEEVVAEVLHPPRRGALGNDNANSIVLHLETCGRRVLLTGDLEGNALDDFLADEPTHYDVVLAPHHGSTRSNPPGFAAWSTPRATIISGGASDISDDVKEAYQAVGSQVFHTAEDGAVRVTLRDGDLRIQTWREER